MDTSQKKKKNSLRQFLSSLLLIVQNVIILAVVGVAIMTFGTRVKFLADLGLNFFAVTSGSMEPSIPTGSLVMAGKFRQDQLKKGDIITYQVSNPENGQSAVVTHRLFEVKENKRQIEIDGKTQEKTEYEFTTKGDANAEPDNYTIGAGSIIGLYKWHLPKLGYVTSWIQSPRGFVLAVVVPIAILIVWELINLIKYLKHYFEGKSQQEIARLKKEIQEQKKKSAQNEN